MNLLSHLISQAKNNTLTHAVLLEGPKGIGKFDLLLEFAKTLLPLSHHHIPYLSKVDVLYTEGKNDNLDELSKRSSFNQLHRKKSKKKTDSIGIDDIEEITKHLHETIDGEYKILIIRDIERMTIPTANKFLKILEEPPVKTLFLLSTSQKQRLLPTIISRVQIHTMPLLSKEEENILLQDHQKNLDEIFDDQLIDDIKLLSSGRKIILKKLLENEEYLETERGKLSEIKNISKLSNLQKMETAEIWAKKGIEDIIQYLFLLECFQRTNLKGSLGDKKKLTISIEKLENLQTARIELLKNGNKRLILEGLLLNY